MFYTLMRGAPLPDAGGGQSPARRGSGSSVPPRLDQRGDDRVHENGDRSGQAEGADVLDGDVEDAVLVAQGGAIAVFVYAVITTTLSRQPRAKQMRPATASIVAIAKCASLAMDHVFPFAVPPVMLATRVPTRPPPTAATNNMGRPHPLQTIMDPGYRSGVCGH